MYCTTCELEIKGDDKATCPVCGGPLIESHADDSALADQSQQEQSSSEEIFKDPSSSEASDPAVSPAGISDEEAFILKDYDSDPAGTDGALTSSGGSEEPQLFEQPDVQPEAAEQPLTAESVQGGSGSMDDVLDSIRESISTSEHPGEEQPVAGGEPVSTDDEDFAFFDSFDTDSSTEAPSENTADESAQVSWGYDEAEDAVAMPDAPERKRSPVFMIALLVVLCGAAGYYFFSKQSDDVQPLVSETSEVVVEPEIEDAAEIVASPAEVESEAAGETAQPSAVAVLEASVIPEDSAGIVSAELAVSGEDEAAKPFIAMEASVPVAPEDPESIVPAEAVASGEDDVAQPSAVVEAEVPIASEESDSVVSSKTAQPPAEAQPAVAIAPEALDAVAPVKPESVTAPFFTVHVGSYRKRTSAVSEVARIKAKDYDAFIERVDLGKKGVWYRVKVGRFKIRAEAEQLQKKIPATDSMVVTQRTN